MGSVSGKCKHMSGDIKRVLDMFFILPNTSSAPVLFCMTRDEDKVKALDENVVQFLGKKAIVKLPKGLCNRPNHTPCQLYTQV